MPSITSLFSPPPATRRQYPIINYLDWEDKCRKEVVFFNNLFNSGTAFGRPLSKDLDCLIEKTEESHYKRHIFPYSQNQISI